MGFTNRHQETEVDPVLTRIVQEDKVPWYKKPNLRYLYFMLMPTCMGVEITSGFDSQLINALQIMTAWRDFYDNPTGPRQGIIAASYSLGAILSLPFVPIINRKFGRRYAIFIGSWIMVAGAIIQGFAQNTANYIIARMILGFGIPMCIVAGSALIGELAYPKERPILTSFFNVSYFVGQIVAAAACYGTNRIVGDWGWRVPSLMQIGPSLLQISLVLFLPESPRWLISKDRTQEAHEILARFHAEGDMNSDFVKAEIAQLTTTHQMEYEAAQESWMDLLSTVGMRRRALVTMMLGLFTQWSGNTLISYYLGDITRMIGYTRDSQIQEINLANSCWALLMGSTVALLVTRFRRRVMYMTCVISLLFVYIGWTISMRYAVEANEAGERNEAAGWAVLVFIFLYNPCYNIGYNALTYTYLVELWPYALRSRGIAFFQLFGRLAGFMTIFVNPIGIRNVTWRYLISYCCWLGFECVFVFFFFPETANKTLEELSFLFEGKEAADRMTSAVEKVIHGEAFETEHKEVVVDNDRKV
ncbi:general substrate transporter [Stachybotrys elegans]|uniref:General substrate transporter n=1 Tax=Stachybotrys elegans TaxID=80388 RepID=A0A8K0SBL3_9HYPO|nr:general substrate transporter [Stachybotrys elegans]